MQFSQFQHSQLWNNAGRPLGSAMAADTKGESDGVERWVPLLYDELRRIARRERVRLFTGGTLATTALVNEAYARLAGDRGFADRGEFLRIASVAIRRILIDRVRAQLAAKRGGGAKHVPIEEADDFVVEDDERVLQVHEALEQLAVVNPRLAKVVECRFFAGYDEKQTAEALGTSERTVQRDWATARAWLKKELGT
jgi:RNA polymerase sigma factor (TIGR02999 family)